MARDDNTYSDNTGGNSTDRGHNKAARTQFGKLLKQFRLRAGLNQSELAAAALISQSVISDLESGKREPRRDVALCLDQALGARTVLFNTWEAAFTGTATSCYGREVAEAERESRAIRIYSLDAVPALVRTGDFLAELTLAEQPQATPAQVQEALREQKRRQTILEGDCPPTLAVLLDETVLRRRFTDPQVMADQIAQLLDCSNRARVKVQIVPSETENHPGLGGSFTVMETGGDVWPTSVCVQSQNAGIVVKHPDMVARYERLFGELAGVALPVPDSRTLMEKIRADLC